MSAESKKRSKDLIFTRVLQFRSYKEMYYESNQDPKCDNLEYPNEFDLNYIIQYRDLDFDHAESKIGITRILFVQYMHNLGVEGIQVQYENQLRN